MEFGLGLLILFSTVLILITLFVLNRELFFYLFIGLVVIQNTASLLYFQYLDVSVVKIWSGLKDIVLLLVFILGFQYLRIKNKVDNFFLIILTFILILIFTSSNSIFDSLKSARPYLTPILLYFFGKSLRFGKAQIERSLKFLLLIFGLLVSIGLVEKIFGEEIWVHLNYESYIYAKYGLTYEGRVGFNNVGFLPFGYGRYIRPMSLFAESVGLGFFLTTIFILIFPKIEKNKIAILVFLLSILLIYIRGSLLVIGICLLTNKLFFRGKELSRIYKTFLILILIFGLAGSTAVAILDPNFLSSHLVSLVTGLNLFMENPLGLGLGSANWINSFSQNELAISSIDSFFATTLVELGIFGILYFLVHMIALQMLMKKSQFPSVEIYILTSYIFASFLISILTASSFSFHNLLIIYTYLGIYVRYEEENSISIHELSISERHGSKNHHKL